MDDTLIVSSSLTLRNKTIQKNLLECQKGHWTTRETDVIPNDFECAICVEIAQIESRNKREALKYVKPAFKQMNAKDIAWVKEVIGKP